MSMAPKLSIIVPVYNAGEYLKECIDSILAGEYKDYEIIMVDDGSKDDSPAIADEYAANHANIKVIHQQNQGQSKARKNGIAISNGEYIGFVDSDDWITPITYGMMMEAAERNGADIVTMAGLRVAGKHSHPFQDSLPSGTYGRQEIKDTVIPGLFMNHDLLGSKGLNPSQGLKIFRRTIVDAAYKEVPDDLSYGEDLIFTYTAAMKSSSIVILPKEYIGYNYRLNPGSISWVHRDGLFQKSMKIVSFFRTYELVKDDPIFQRELDYTSCFFAINAFLNEYLMKNPAPLSERRKVIAQIIDSDEIKGASSRISTSEAGFMNRTIVKLMKNGKLGTICFIGSLISLFRKPITAISQKIF